VCTRPDSTASVNIVDKHLRKLGSGGVIRVGIPHRVERPASEGNDGNWAEAKGPRHDHLILAGRPRCREVNGSTPALLCNRVGLGSETSSDIRGRDGERLAEARQTLGFEKTRRESSDRFNSCREAAQDREEEATLPLRLALNLEDAAHLLTHARKRASELVLETRESDGAALDQKPKRSRWQCCGKVGVAKVEAHLLQMAPGPLAQLRMTTPPVVVVGEECVAAVAET
jgi:hypothetical protein